MKKSFIVNPKKTKLSRLLLIIGFFASGVLFSPVTASTSLSYSQTKSLTVKLENKTIKEVFEYIEKNSEFVFLYYDNILDTRKKVHLNVTDQPVNTILNQLFEGTGLNYEIEDRQIVITKAEKSGKTNAPQQQHVLQGKVLDEAGEPLPGVSILIAGSTRGVTTDVDGSFEINVKSTDKLIFSYLGMQDQTITIGDQKTIVVKLKQQVDELDEVTIVAFGKQKKESVIGAITTLSTASLKVPVGKISTSLAGQLAGLVVTQTSGEPGAGANFWIRGISSFGEGNKGPLVLVDGMERSMDLVDAEDIESFSILKDATATAVYGVRGANGIVLITTKKGKEGKPVIRANVEYGISTPTVMPRIANAEQWIDYYNDISLDATGRPAYSAEQKAMFLNGTDPDLYPNVDWMKEIFKNSSNSQRINLNVSGGGKKVRYYVSGSYYSEGGILNAKVGTQYNPSLRYNKFSFRSNVDIDLSSSTQLNLNLSNQYETKNRPGSDLNQYWIRAIETTPIVTPTVYSDGTIASPANGTNPYNMLNNTGYSSDFWNNTQSLIGLTQDFSDLITPGLKANLKFSWDAYNGVTLDKRKGPASYDAVGRDEEGKLIYHKNSDGSDYLGLEKGNSGNRSLALEASVTYERVFNQVHRVGGLFLFNMREYNDNFPNDYIASFTHKNQGIAARATYSYMDKYFIEGNFGYNGSENFSPGNKFGFFPSIAAGYLISNEKFFEGLSSVIDLIKIKGSYGLIGSDDIGGQRFAFNSEMKLNGGYHFGQMGENWVGGIATGRPGNPNISWETAKKTNIGVEFGLFNKFKAQIDYFHENREGIYIEQYSVPSIVGNNVRQWINLGKMMNGGVDASLEYNQTIGDFMIQGRANFTFNRNKKLYDDAPTPVWAYREDVGVPFGQDRGLIALGLFESEEEIQNSPRQFGGVKPGDIKYKDINGDRIIDSNDEIAIGRTKYPEFNYGFGVTMGWKGFDLSLFFSGVGHVTRFIGGSAIYGQAGNILPLGGFFAEVAEGRWTLDNPDPHAKYPRMYMSPSENNRRNSTFYQRDMSFLRLKNAEFGYTIPKNITNKAGLSTVRLYVQGLNLLTFSKFKMWDPELDTTSGMSYPNMTVVNFGLNVNL